MGRKPDLDMFIPPEIAMFGNRFARRFQASATNLRTYWSWWQLFYTAAVTSFKWVGLPECIDERYFETGLFLNGTMAFTQRTSRASEEFHPYFVASYATEGKLDIYNNPNKLRLTTANGMQFTRHAGPHVRRRGNQYVRRSELMQPNAVVCWDNLTRLPLFNAIDLACRRLAEFDVTIDQHVRAERVPYIFYVPEEGKANAEAMYNSIDSGQPAIFLAPASNSVITAQVLGTGVNYIADKLLNDELKIVAQTYTLLGIDNNAAAEKRERVQTAETVANNEQFLMQRAARQRARDQFCERVAEVFGLAVSCEWSVPRTWETGADGEAYDASQSGMLDPSYSRHADPFGEERSTASDNAI